jgi:NAD(P)H-hydrate epimerase
MSQFLTRAQVRAVDAEPKQHLGGHGRVLVCCGKGNNGGDGFVIARHLANRRVPVQILLFCAPEELTGDAAINHRIAVGLKLPVEVHSGADVDVEALARELATAEWVVDALFGTGLSGPVRPPLDGAIEAINRSPARVLAVDIPSGLDCDSGRPLGATVRAHHTVTFAAQKTGFANPEARTWLGHVHLVDIGVPV